MQRAPRIVLAIGFGLALAACVDLFHSTNFETACDVDAAACSSADVAVCSADSSSSLDACAPVPEDAGRH